MLLLLAQRSFLLYQNHQKSFLSASREGSRTSSDWSAIKRYPHVLSADPGAAVPSHCLVVQDRAPFDYEPDYTRTANGSFRLPGLGSRLSPADFKATAEVVFGDLDKPVYLSYTKLTPRLVPCLQPGVVIFADTHHLSRFRQEILPELRVPFVLVTGDSDDSAPAHHLEVMQSPYLLRWYGMNCDMDPQDRRLQGRFLCLPLGNSQWNGQRAALHPVLEELGLADQSSGRLEKRARLLLSSFAVESNRMARAPVLKHLETLPFAETGYHRHRDKHDFYRHMAQFQFVVSPHGNGLDCYRTWEALYLGCIPVVKTSTLDSSYAGLPVLILQEWTDLTQELLEETWRSFSARTFDFGPLYRGHWQRRFYADRLQSEEGIEGSGGSTHYLHTRYCTTDQGTSSA